MPLQSSLISQTSEKIAFQLPLRFSIKIVQEITMWGTHQLVGFMLCWSDTVVKLKINSQLADQVEEKNVRRMMIHLVPDISVCRSSYYISTVIHKKHVITWNTRSVSSDIQTLRSELKNEEHCEFFNKPQSVLISDETFFGVFDIASGSIYNSWRNSKQKFTEYYDN